MAKVAILGVLALIVLALVLWVIITSRRDKQRAAERQNSLMLAGDNTRNAAIDRLNEAYATSQLGYEELIERLTVLNSGRSITNGEVAELLRDLGPPGRP